MEAELEDLGWIPAEMGFKIADRLVAIPPDCLLVQQTGWDGLALQDFRMHANDEHFLVIGPIEHADSTALRKTQRRAPQEIVVQFRLAGMLEAVDLATLGVN